MKYFILIVASFFYSVNLTAGSVDTVSVYSNSMHKEIKSVVIKPDTYGATENKFPVVYLLHGYGGWYSNWIIRVPELKEYADTYQTIIVCPDGDKSSWYFDSPIDSAYRYETFVSFELVDYVDKHFKTLADKKHRAITGLSMGGHGGLFLGLRHATVFGAAGSMSGAVDLKDSRSKYEIMKRIGDTISHSREWHDLTVINLIENHRATDLKIVFDCGDEDIFIESNRRLHEKMKQLKVLHEYIERPGKHNWEYWKNAIPFQLLFFQRFFNGG